MILGLRSGARVEAEVGEPPSSDDDGIQNFINRLCHQVRIGGRGYSPVQLRLFSIIEATDEERIRLALGGYDLPEAQPRTQTKDPR